MPALHSHFLRDLDNFIAELEEAQQHTVYNFIIYALYIYFL